MKDWKNLKRHSLSAQYDDIEGTAWEAFKAGMVEDGFDPAKPISLYCGEVLDGWQRYRACVELDIGPKFLKLPKSTDIFAYVEKVNDRRRHDTPAKQRERAEARRVRVKEKRDAGASIREIAESEGVGKATVERDLSATVPPGTENASAPSENAKKMCGKCQRVGGVAGCLACAALNEKQKSTRGKKQTPPDAGDAYEGDDKEDKTARDVDGLVLPKRLKDVFADAFLGKSADDLNAIIKHLKNNQSIYPWANLSLILTPLKDVVTHIGNARPHAVHQACDGKGCPECRNTGWLPKWRKVELEAQPA